MKNIQVRIQVLALAICAVVVGMAFTEQKAAATLVGGNPCGTGNACTNDSQCPYYDGYPGGVCPCVSNGNGETRNGGLCGGS